MKILVVDDNCDLADSLAELLAYKGHQVTSVYSGEKAMEQIRANDFNTLFLDVKLPGISGIEVFRLVRKLKPEIKIILITAYRINQLIAEMLGVGDVGVLHKPFTDVGILDKFRSIKGKGGFLAIDDSLGLAVRMHQILRLNGYKPLLVQCRHDTVNQVLSSEADYLLLDLRRPVIDSIAICMELTDRDCMLPTAIVCIGQDKETSSADMLRSMSVTGCLFKPFKPHEILKGLA